MKLREKDIKGWGAEMENVSYDQNTLDTPT